MGYDLHITRKANWSNPSPVITLHDWLDYVTGDPEIQHDGFAETRIGNGNVVRVEQVGICIWKAYSGGENPQGTAWLTWSAGNIVAKNPDQEIRRKMWLIAQALDAKVQGDEGECYDQAGETIAEPTVETASAPSMPEDRRRPWWKFW